MREVGRERRSRLSLVESGVEEREVGGVKYDVGV